MFQCRICSGQQQSASYVVKEMQLGTRAQFTYQLCGDCGCLQIEQLPENLAAYYPSDYYSKKTRTVKTTDRLLDFLPGFGSDAIHVVEDARDGGDGDLGLGGDVVDGRLALWRLRLGSC